MSNVVMDMMYKDLFEVLLSVLLDLCPAVELLDHMGVLVLLSEELPCCFPKQSHHFTVPTSSAQGPRFLHFLTNTCYFVFLRVAILLGLRCFFTVALIYK